MRALLPFKLVYHERMIWNLGPHVFPSQKFRLIYEMLLREGIATKMISCARIRRVTRIYCGVHTAIGCTN